jgi:hypothetical protein
MRERGVGMDPGEAVLGEGQGAQKRRRERHRMDRRADVVDEAGQGELGRARAAADRRLRLQHDDGLARACEDDRRREAVRTGADDDGIIGGAHRVHGRTF